MNNIIPTTCLLLLLLPLASCTKNKQVFIFQLLLLLISFFILSSDFFLQIYLVEFGENTNEDTTLHEIENTHRSYLLLVKETEEDAKTSFLYSYKHTFNGFAALLTPDEANNLSGN